VKGTHDRMNWWHYCPTLPNTNPPCLTF